MSNISEIKNTIIEGDCLEVLKTLEENSVDSIVTDPPAGISFMGKGWDSNKGGRDNWITWMSEIAKECLRVLKPGGHAFVWAIPRTSHWTATSWENAGFEIREIVAHIFGSGFPKSLNIGKKIDQLQGNEREVTGLNRAGKNALGQDSGWNPHKNKTEFDITKGTSKWEGWGTALKPAREDWLLMRKPIESKTVAENVLKYGTGGINIDGCRVEAQKGDRFGGGDMATGGYGTFKDNYKHDGFKVSTQGRFPANLCWSCDCANNYLTGNDLFDILSNISNQIKLCQSKNLNSNALNVEQKKHQQDTTNEEKKMCFAVENVDTLFLEKILGKTLEVIFSEDTECSVEMLEKSMNTSLSISLSGNEKMGEYQKVLKYIILTATKLITELKTCNLSQLQIIGNFITKVISGIQEQSRVKSHSSDCWVRECFPETKTGAVKNTVDNGANQPINLGGGLTKERPVDSGNASRFFKSIIYTAKASKSERNMGCEGLEEKIDCDRNPELNSANVPMNRSNNPKQNYHPTVKPIALMEYLINMICPKGGTVLDPFMGSGTTGVACKNLNRHFIGIEKDEKYCEIARKRINAIPKSLFA